MIDVDPLDEHFPRLPPGMSAADATHELNNLLTVVLGSMEQLQRQALDDRGKAQLDRAQAAVEQANKLLQQMMGPHDLDSTSTH